MPEKVVPGPVSEDRCIREAVCIHTKKIFDSCKDKDIASLILIIFLDGDRVLASRFSYRERDYIPCPPIVSGCKKYKNAAEKFCRFFILFEPQILPVPTWF